MTAHITPARPTGIMPVPPSKSMAHRMLICSALARGFSRVDNLDYSVDIDTTIDALCQLGAKVEKRQRGAVVEGLPGGFATVTRPVNCNESGSTLRFLIPLFSLTGQKITFVGAQRLLQRPLTAYADIFTKQGLGFGGTGQEITIKGMLRPGEFSLPGNVSSQFISGLLFALPLLHADSVIRITPPLESRSYIELTRTAQSLFGVQSHWQDQYTLLVPGGQAYTAKDTTVEGDWSQGVVPAVLGAVCGGVAAKGLSPTSPQGDVAVLDIVQRAGASISWQDGLLRVSPPAAGLVAPGDVDLADCPDLGPVLCAFALFCKGKTRFVNAGRLRIKESDRIGSVQQVLGALGGRVSSTQDTITIEGGFPLLSGKTLPAHNDHRVAMALAVAAVCGGVPLTIEGAECVRKSWPGFFGALAGLGIEVAGA